MGDINVIWLAIILSFFVPSMLMKKKSEDEIKKEEPQEEKMDAADTSVKSTESVQDNEYRYTSMLVAKFVEIFGEIDSKIPKFSEWQDWQKQKKLDIQSAAKSQNVNTSKLNTAASAIQMS